LKKKRKKTIVLKKEEKKRKGEERKKKLHLKETEHGSKIEGKAQAIRKGDPTQIQNINLTAKLNLPQTNPNPPP
jgi:hypothetical protein